MALASNESFLQGFVRTAAGEIACTRSLIGATFYLGFLRDVDGRLVIQNG